MDECLNTFTSADDLSVAILVLVVCLPPSLIVVRKRGKAPEDGPGEELHQLGDDGDVVDDLGGNSIALKSLGDVLDKFFRQFFGQFLNFF